MKSYDEMTKSLLKRRELYISARKEKMKKVRAAATGCACLCLAALFGLSVFWMDTPVKTENGEKQTEITKPLNVIHINKVDSIQVASLPQYTAKPSIDSEGKASENGEKTSDISDYGQKLLKEYKDFLQSISPTLPSDITLRGGALQGRRHFFMVNRLFFRR